MATCPEKIRLLEEYQAATSTFADAVAVLKQRAGTSTKFEYERLQRVCDEAREKSEQTRLAWEQHIAGHEC
jgi:hypothetical protein